jgi:hypothetical protein
MSPKKGISTPNKPPENPTWTLDEGEEMRRDINELQNKMDSLEANMDSLDTKMDSMEAKLDTKIDGLKGEIMEVLKNFITEKTPESENASHEIHDVDTRMVNQEWRNSNFGLKILGYDFEIVYKKGKQNVVVDALSRKDEDVEAFLCAISIIQPDWIIEARDEWKNDEKVWTLIQKLQQDSSASDSFAWKNDSLWYKYCLYLCKNSQLKQKVLLELHTSPVGGHSRFLKTYHRVKKDFFWDGLKTNVQRFVVECVVCQQNKVETIKTPGLLQPLSIPSQCWEEVSMDFITGLPKSEGKSVIMVRPSMHTFVHSLIPSKLVQLPPHSWRQFKSYMAAQRLL